MLGRFSAGSGRTPPRVRFFAAVALLLASSAAVAGVGDQAPSLRATAWINGESAATTGYRGAVTLVEFWTFACWNCRNVEPYVKAWHERFAPKGLQVIAIHSPELPQERVIENVRRYVAEREIRYPIAIDNDFAIWKAFGNRAWPTWYLIDRSGRIRYVHVGEGAYAETEAAIEKLLAEN